MRRTKIVCTIGPASRDGETLAAMLDAGMDVARVNASHASGEEIAATIRLVREVARGRHLAVLLDLAGPKLRTGPVSGGLVILASGAEVRLEPGDEPSTPERIATGYEGLAADVRPAEPVLLDDGRIALEAVERDGDALVCRVVEGGALGARKGIALPASTLSLPALTEADRETIAVGAAEGVDFFGLSFAASAAHVHEARGAIARAGAEAPVIAKIERRAAAEHLEAIVAAADGVMVARGDLGVELPPEAVPVQQRRIIEAANRELVPVITATEMLQSMIDSPAPRAQRRATWPTPSGTRPTP